MQFPFLDQQHDHGGRHRLGIRGDPKMRIGARQRRAAQLRQRDVVLFVRFWGESGMARPPLAYRLIADDPKRS
jgi:hypothetical protein